MSRSKEAQLRSVRMVVSLLAHMIDDGDVIGDDMDGE
jgi:hypothetical protein